ncbi:MAG: hypothetical protein H0U71_03625 [Gammaproteobacteria bacterium]|nr:hypothetical protein [Gammaproteobacteria bacterium]
MMNNSEIKKNPSLAHSEVLKKICSPLVNLGIHFFGYTAIDINGNAFCLGSKPDYAAEYLRHNHARNDVHCRFDKAPKKYHYDFWDYLKIDRPTEELYRMAAAFDQGHTLTISQHAEEITHCFHFSGHMTDIGINQRYIEKMDSLHAFILYFKKCLQSIPEIAAVYQYPVQIVSNKKIHKKKVVAVSLDPKSVALINTLKDTIYFRNQFHYFLTENELECLKWLKLGKSAVMIAKIHNVSYKTIERYIEACKQKYQCYTLFQLGEKTSTAGLAPFLELL